MQPESSPLVKKVAAFFSIKDFVAESNVELQGRSGARHKFDLMVTSKQGGKERLAVLDRLSQDTINDMMMFNACAEDCGIQLKVISVDRELNDPEINLLNTYHISVIDKRSDEMLSLRPVLFGITELDRMINGSMKKGNVYLISGGVGVGKTVLSSHFLLQGARLKEKVAIILTDSKKDQFLDNARSMFPDFFDFYKAGVIELIELSESLRSLRGDVIHNRRNIRKYISRLATEIRDTVTGSKIQRLVIDPITPMILEDEELINQFFNALAIPQCITVLTSGTRRSEFSVYGMEEYYVSGVLHLETDLAPGETKKATIIKMRGGSFSPGPLYFKITENGVVESQREKLLDVLSYDKTKYAREELSSESIAR